MNWSFEYPFAFLLVVLYFLCKRYCLKKAKESYFSNFGVLITLSKKRKNIFELLEFLIIFFLALSIASPIIQKEISLDNTKGYEILLTLDASTSMQDDNRFKIMKKIVQEFIQKRKYDSLGLTLFAQNVYIASPFTYDKKPLQDIVKYIDIGVAGSVGTSLYDALYTSGNLFKNSHAKNKICILLTDGIDTKKNIALDAAIANVKKQAVKVYVIGVGKDGEYRKDILEKIAKETGGKFFHTDDPKQLQSIYDTIDSLEKSKIVTKTINQIQYYYTYPTIFSLILLFIYIILSKKYKNITLVLSVIFLLITLYKPYYTKENKHFDTNVKFIVALDISKSMLANDILPNRFEFAKRKIQTLLNHLEKEKISLMAFSNQAYLISPFSNNYEIIRFLLQNLELQNINQNGTEISKLLQASDQFFEKGAKKAILLLTDGGEQKDFSKEIAYAKQHNISLFIYDISTLQGSAVSIDGKLIKDTKGDIVISKRNEHIKNLALQTGGIYTPYSLSDSDLDPIIDKIQENFDQNKILNSSINRIELFYFPLLLSFILFLFSIFGFKRKIV